MDDFAQAIASHPYFAKGWTLKVCQWFNSIDCLADPNNAKAIDAIALNFKQSNYSFKQLVVELFSSS